MDQILLRPIITEKSLQEAGRGRYTFAVEKGANKIQIAQAVAETFAVHPEGVKTITKKGKATRSMRRRTKVLRSDWKKAVIQLKTGEKIEIFETQGEERK